MAEELPRQFGDYVLERRLGVGGMAETFVARRGVLQQRVCLKRVLPAFSRDQDFVRQFEREARLAGRLRHSNVVGVLDFGAVGGELYLALELVEGVDLRALIQTQPEGRLPVDLVALIALDLSYALEYAHGEQVVHRDVTPSNVLLSVRGEVKLADFGVAKALTGSTLPTASGLIKGKVPYMAPEQMKGGAIDGRTDLFSVGVTLFEMLAGRRPFIGSHDVEVMMKVMTGERPTLKELAPRTPAAIANLVEQLLSGDQSARPSDAGELLDVLAGEVRPDSREKLGQWVRAAYGTEAPGERDTELASSPIGLVTPRPAMRVAPSDPAPAFVAAPLSASPPSVVSPESITGPAASAASAAFDPRVHMAPSAGLDAAALAGPVINATAPARPAAFPTVVDPPGGHDEAASSGVWAPGTRREAETEPREGLAATRVSMARPRNDPPSAPRMLAVQEPAPKGRPWALIAVVGVLLLAVVGGGLAFLGGGEEVAAEVSTLPPVGTNPPAGTNTGGSNPGGTNLGGTNTGGTDPGDTSPDDPMDPEPPGAATQPPTGTEDRDTVQPPDTENAATGGGTMRAGERQETGRGEGPRRPGRPGPTPSGMEPEQPQEPEQPAPVAMVELTPPPPPPPPPPPAERGTGRLVVNVIPWGEVWVDGRYMGRAPINTSMPVGNYVVRGGHGQPSSARMRVRVSAGQTAQVDVPLE